MKSLLTITLITLAITQASLGYANAITDMFPSSNQNSELYYQMGGGRSVPVPPVNNSVTAPIDVQGNIGLGFSCGKFSPVNTITNSLNNFKDSVQNVPGSIVSRATSSITSFPMYKLAQADPKLYNILNNNVIGAHNQFSLNMKSCEEMQSEALKGHDPYDGFITVSRNNNMKHLMSFGDGDLNKAMSNVNQNQGDNGVPWATPGQSLGASAGGEGQKPIMVINDTAIAGYNVLLGRNATDTSTPDHSHDEQNLLNYWQKPQDAAQWIVAVVGDQKVTTCTSKHCQKDSSPGVGLLPYVQHASTQISQTLAQLVSGQLPTTKDHLLAVSAPGQVVSGSLIRNIRQMSHNAQGNTVATLAQNIATTRVINEALLAINVLQTGSEVPNIHAVGPAQKVITHKIKQLQSDIDHIMYSVNIRRKLNSNVMSHIMQYTKAKNNQAAGISQVGTKPAVMTNGGIVKKDQSP